MMFVTGFVAGILFVLVVCSLAYVEGYVEEYLRQRRQQ